MDLFLFELSVHNKVTLERENIHFAERPTKCDFEEKRVQNLISEDFFHNFRPLLYKKKVAVSSYTIDRDFLNSSSIARLYPVLQNHTSQYPLYDELNKMNIRKFVAYGMSHIDEWSIKDRLFFSCTLQAVVEGFWHQRAFYGKYVDIDRITGELMEDISKSFVLFNARSNHLSSGEEVERDIISLFDLAQESLIESANRNYVIPSVKEKVPRGIISLFDLVRESLIDSANKNYVILNEEEYDDELDQIIPDRNFLNFVYSDISAKEYLTFLFESNIEAEHTFVLLKDYYDLLSCTSAYREYRGYHNLLSDNLIKAMGVTEPILKYYPSVRFASRDDILAAFEYSMDSREDILYLQDDDGQADNHVKRSEGKTTFSYEVLSYNPNVLSLEYEASGAGYLYFSDCYDTYWRATVDGDKTSIYRANVAFKAVKVPEGMHKVEFVYDPKPFRLSLWFYYAAFCIGLIYLGAGAFKKVGAA
jgi:hypothetical protein